MRDGFRQSMAWLHTWSGLLICWVLFTIFLAGTLTYFRDEITLWMKPELHAAALQPVPSALAARNAVKALEERAPQATRWLITLPSDRNPSMRIGWTNPPTADEIKSGKRNGRFQSEVLVPATGEMLSMPRATRGGDFFYRLHFDLHYMPAVWARWIVGFCAMFMLVAIISGVITHRRIFKDFFTFRPNKGQRSWLDAHNAAAVLALPYHLMITYTGLVTLMFLYMPSGAAVAYKGDQKTFLAEVFPSIAQAGKPSGVKAMPAPIDIMLAQAERRWNGAQIESISISNPGDAAARVNIIRAEERSLSHKQPAMQFNGVTGAVLSTGGDDLSAASSAHGVMFGLHLARFAGPLLRTLFFLSGLAGCAMVATGALLWAVKLHQKRAKLLVNSSGFGLRLVDGLNIGAIAGLPIAMVSFFWANRLLPVTLQNRPETEINCFFIAWGLAALIAHVKPSIGMWRLQLTVGAGLFAGLPLLNVVTTSSHIGVTLLQGRGPWAVAGFDLVALAFGMMLGYAAWKLNGRARKGQGLSQAPQRAGSAALKEAA